MFPGQYSTSQSPDGTELLHGVCCSSSTWVAARTSLDDLLGVESYRKAVPRDPGSFSRPPHSPDDLICYFSS